MSLQSRRARYSGPTWIVIAVGLPIVFAICVADGEWISAGIVALTGLALGLFYLWTAKVMRDVAEFLEELPDAPAGPPSEAMLAVDAFDEAISDARGVPLTDQIRLGRGRVDGLLDRLRRAPPPLPSEWGSLLYELDALIQRAKPIPLTDEIRLDREKVYDIVDRMRAAFAEVRRE